MWVVEGTPVLCSIVVVPGKAVVVVPIGTAPTVFMAPVIGWQGVARPVEVDVTTGAAIVVAVVVAAGTDTNFSSIMVVLSRSMIGTLEVVPVMPEV